MLLARPQHVAASAAVWGAAERGRVEGLIAAHAVTTIHYLLRKELGASRAKSALTFMLRVFTVAAVDEGVVQEALSADFSDFEDAITAAAAIAASCDLIVTRNARDFQRSRVRAATPEMTLPMLG